MALEPILLTTKLEFFHVTVPFIAQNCVIWPALSEQEAKKVSILLFQPGKDKGGEPSNNVCHRQEA